MIVFEVDPTAPAPDAIRAAADAIRRGELVIFPTETVYGLAADALNEAAVRRVFEVKGRMTTQPLPVQVAGADRLDRVASSVPEVARALAEEFWPGPLTIVLAKSSDLSDLVTAGGPSVGVRVPDHPVALALLTEVGTPIVATSANLSGQPPALTARGAIDAVGSSVAVVLDSGRCEIGVPSTVVDVTTDPPTIPRHGAISDADIHRVISRVRRGGE